jgi:hypothetical protein
MVAVPLKPLLLRLKLTDAVMLQGMPKLVPLALALEVPVKLKPLGLTEPEMSADSGPALR